MNKGKTEGWMKREKGKCTGFGAHKRVHAQAMEERRIGKRQVCLPLSSEAQGLPQNLQKCPVLLDCKERS